MVVRQAECAAPDNRGQGVRKLPRDVIYIITTDIHERPSRKKKYIDPNRTHSVSRGGRDKVKVTATVNVEIDCFCA